MNNMKASKSTRQFNNQFIENLSEEEMRNLIVDTIKEFNSKFTSNDLVVEKRNNSVFLEIINRN